MRTWTLLPDGLFHKLPCDFSFDYVSSWPFCSLFRRPDRGAAYRESTEKGLQLTARCWDFSLLCTAVSMVLESVLCACAVLGKQLVAFPA